MGKGKGKRGRSSRRKPRYPDHEIAFATHAVLRLRKRQISRSEAIEVVQFGKNLEPDDVYPRRFRADQVSRGRRIVVVFEELDKPGVVAVISAFTKRV